MENRKDLTRRLIADGFKSLMLRRPFEKISILMITSEAGIRRPSFYNHFQDKYDLLEWIVDTEVIAPAAEPLRAGRRREALRGLFDRLTENRDFYRKAFAVTGQNGFEEAFVAGMRDLFLENLPMEPPPEQAKLLPARTTALFHAVCFVSAVKTWLEGGVQVSADELTEAYSALAGQRIWTE